MFVFTFAFAFFCNTMMTAQCQLPPGEARLNFNIEEEGNSFSFRGILSEVHTSPSYNFIVTIDDAPSNVSNVYIDFGNGQTVYVDLSNAVYPVVRNYTVAYTDLSSKIVTVDANMATPGSTPVSWSRTLTRYDYTRAINSPTYQTPDETVTIGGINAHIKYAPSNSARQLKKPIIFVEGIDFGRRTLCDFTGKPVKVGAFGWDTFITGMVDDPTDSDNETFAMLPTFANDMLAQGYDMVFCDFRDGTASIEANGQSMIAVINEVNRRKQANLSPKQNCYTNSIVGASMGGQVVRWALKTMENQNTEHDCKLYFSLDSPHKGATIPLALQAFIKFGAEHGQEDGTRQLFRERWQGLNTPAPKQLLAFHLANNGEHTAYMNMMTQLGYPQKTRNIASANGSGVGTNQGYANNALLIGAQGSVTIGSLSGVAFKTNLFASGNGKIAELFRVQERPTSRNWYAIEVGAMQLEKLSNNSVMYRERESRMALAQLIFGGSSWSASHSVSFDKDFTNWDNAPGGNRNDLGGDFLKAIVEAFESEGLSHSEIPPQGRQAFIPTVSALDLATDDMHTNAKSFIGGDPMVPNSNTPFKSIFIQKDNQAHVFMSEELLNFAKTEIFANTRVSCGLSTTELPKVGEEPTPQVPIVGTPQTETQVSGGLFRTTTTTTPKPPKGGQ